MIGPSSVGPSCDSGRVERDASTHRRDHGNFSLAADRARVARVQGYQRRRARRIDASARPLQPESVRDSPSGDRDGTASGCNKDEARQ